MAENDAVTDSGAEPEADAPSLELPSLFGRRKKRVRTAPAAAPVEPPTVQAEPPTVPAEPPTVPAEKSPAEQPDVERTTVIPAPEAAPAAPTTHVEPQALPAEQPTTHVEPLLMPADEPAVDHDETPAPEEQRRRRTPRLPALAATTTAVAVGAVVGLLGCALTFLGLKTCELITSTDSCGGPGLLLLLVIVVAMALVGAALLRLFTVEDALNLSVLGVGITVAVVLMFLLDYLYEPWMFVVMPLLTAVGFLAARWITTRYVDDVLAEDDVEVHDVR